MQVNPQELLILDNNMRESRTRNRAVRELNSAGDDSLFMNKRLKKASIPNNQFKRPIPRNYNKQIYQSVDNKSFRVDQSLS